MCGIVGYIGKKQAVPLLVSGLERLEYRGYDSAGVATLEKDGFQIIRSVGKLINLKEKLKLNGQVSSASIGIGHTRWATHGRPSETNAHPHVAGKICVVHNGIIENYSALRNKLQKEGCVFLSETDTEIATHLINKNYEKTKDILEAVRIAINELQGSYALLAMCADDPGRLIVARNACPIVIGLSQSENFVASDIPAVLEHTRDILVLEDGEIAEVRADQVNIEDKQGSVKRDVLKVTWDPITAEKGGYRHFMLKEIYEQPEVVTDTFRGRINLEEGSVFLDNVSLVNEFSKFDRVCIVACGTAWHAGLVTKFFIERMTKLPVEVDYASEFRYRTPIVDAKTLFIVISQSGETADTLGSLTLAKELGARTLAICNVVGSTIARRAENVFYTHAGPEISVASTKAFVTQLTAGYLLSLGLGLHRGAVSIADAKKRLEDLVHLPHLLGVALTKDEEIGAVAKRYCRASDFLYLGRGLLYPIALEGALKLKEISYLHAEGYPAGEMKHGPIALIDDNVPVVVVLGHDGLNYDKTISNMVEVKARGGKIIAITDVATPQLDGVADEVIAIGKTPVELLPMVLSIPLQLLAYHIAVERGTDVDQPRNLAKSVTVE